MNSTPQVSIIIPAFQSERTIANCLRTMLAQSFEDHELIVIDSSPDELTGQIVRDEFPAVVYRHNAKRMLPYEARNRAIELAQGKLFAFADPDVYAHKTWLESLVATYLKLDGGVVAGAIACYGHKPIELGMHYGKFDKWLPGGDITPIDIAATANMLCDRRALGSIGGFDGDSMLGDTLMSWSLKELGTSIWFDPNAIVEHHHFGGWRSLLRERYDRGREFAHLRVQAEGWSKQRALIQAIISVFPLRLTKLALRGMSNASRSGTLRDFLLISPIPISGQAAWLAGESSVYIQSLRGSRRSL
ncbi:MAG: glycosyltransferase family 2 protein [Anaerolineales bacterium]